jgi:pyridoxine 4-dehydrogenase
MARLDAGKSGTFKIGGDIEIHFGVMRITGKGIWVRRKIALRR